MINRNRANLGTIMLFRKIVLELETAIWDGIYGISTLGCVPGERPSGALNGDAVYFQSKCFFHLKKIIRQMPMTEKDVFYDIGCGSGRMVCIAALKNVKKCVGVEISEKLSGLANRNAASMRFRKAAIEILQSDACKVDYTEGTVFALFNPFGAKTLSIVLERIRMNVMHAPRKVRFIYLNPVERPVFD